MKPAEQNHAIQNASSGGTNPKAFLPEIDGIIAYLSF